VSVIAGVGSTNRGARDGMQRIRLVCRPGARYSTAPAWWTNVCRTEVQPGRRRGRHRGVSHMSRRSWQCVTVALSVPAVLATGCAASPAAPAKSPSAAVSPTGTSSARPAVSRAPRTYGTRCLSSQLRLTAGPPVSEAAEQYTLRFVLRNVSAEGCDMRGYPDIALVGSKGNTLGFTYRTRGDAMLTSSPPALVPLAPGAAAYTAINKGPCPHYSDSASRIKITPPDNRKALILTLPGYLDFGYCSSEFSDLNVVDVAPVEPSIAAISPYH
jgi:uncharacterized protein DUF4232